MRKTKNEVVRTQKQEAKIFAMNSYFRYHSENSNIANFTIQHCSFSFLLLLFQLPCFQPALFHSSSFDILHSRLFGYGWIDTIIWPPIPAKTIKTASECNQKCNRDPNMSIGLIIIISIQKALKNY